MSTHSDHVEQHKDHLKLHEDIGEVLKIVKLLEWKLDEVCKAHKEDHEKHKHHHKHD